MVLVIEGASVPVNMDMEVGDGDGVTDDTSKVEGNVLALDKWVWVGSGVGLVEREDTEIVVALSEGNISGSLDHVGSGFKEVLDEIVLRVVSWVEEINLEAHREYFS